MSRPDLERLEHPLHASMRHACARYHREGGIVAAGDADRAVDAWHAAGCPEVESLDEALLRDRDDARAALDRASLVLLALANDLDGVAGSIRQHGSPLPSLDGLWEALGCGRGWDDHIARDAAVALRALLTGGAP